MALEKTFDVGADCSQFSSYINRLRDDLRDPTRPPLFDGLSMLRPFTTVPQQWLHLTLVVDSTSIVVWVRTDNLYVIGFRGATRTWEFLPDSGNPRHLIGGSEFLRFTGSYTSDGIGDILQDQRDLGRQPLVDAIRGLAAYTGQVNQQALARTWLRTVVLTMSESIRSQEVCDRVGDLLREWTSAGPTTRMIDIIRNWSKISACLIRSANNPDHSDGLYRGLSVIGISNTYLARQVVAIVYRGPIERAEREKRSVSGHAVDDVPTGLTLVEIFQVVILNIDGEHPGDLYGTITVNDGLNPKVLFSRDRSNTQSVSPGGLAELTGPARAVWGYDEVIIDVDLMDKDSFPDLSPDDEISKGQIVWNMYDTPEDEYNEVKDHVVKGKHGAVNVRYAVITNAVVATVVVVLTNGDGESWPDLYGTLTAATAMFNSVNITLFDRKRKDIVQVQAGAPIPLLRNVVVVPLGSSLQINADLWDRDSLPDLSPDDQIAKGEAKFDASPDGTEETKEIRGPHGVVTVRVTWSSN